MDYVIEYQGLTRKQVREWLASRNMAYVKLGRYGRDTYIAACIPFPSYRISQPTRESFTIERLEFTANAR